MLAQVRHQKPTVPAESQNEEGIAGAASVAAGLDMWDVRLDAPYILGLCDAL